MQGCCQHSIWRVQSWIDQHSVRVRLVSICTLQASIRATLASALPMIVLGDKCHGIMDYRRLRRLELGLMRDA